MSLACGIVPSPDLSPIIVLLQKMSQFCRMFPIPDPFVCLLVLMSLNLFLYPVILVNVFTLEALEFNFSGKNTILNVCVLFDENAEYCSSYCSKQPQMFQMHPVN